MSHPRLQLPAAVLVKAARTMTSELLRRTLHEPDTTQRGRDILAAELAARATREVKRPVS